jgi:hypothetical protein
MGFFVLEKLIKWTIGAYLLCDTQHAINASIFLEKETSMVRTTTHLYFAFTFIHHQIGILFHLRTLCSIVT